jgi:hypothetical protein
MGQPDGLDVSLEQAGVCVLDCAGLDVREADVASEPEALIARFASHGAVMTWSGLEAGPPVPVALRRNGEGWPAGLASLDPPCLLGLSRP